MATFLLLIIFSPKIIILTLCASLDFIYSLIITHWKIFAISS